VQQLYTGDIPDWITTFIDAAWSVSDSDGQRQPINRIDPITAVNTAALINVGMQEKREVYFQFKRDESGGTFETIYYWDDSVFELAQELTNIWSQRLNLANCQVCNALLVPSKGRVTKFCSNNCRVAGHRTKPP